MCSTEPLHGMSVPVLRGENSGERPDERDVPLKKEGYVCFLEAIPEVHAVEGVGAAVCLVRIIAVVQEEDFRLDHELRG